jgi:hypothetical protein
VVPVRIIRAKVRVELHLHSFLTLALGVGEWSGFKLRPFYPRYTLNWRLIGSQGRSGRLGDNYF